MDQQEGQEEYYYDEEEYYEESGMDLGTRDLRDPMDSQGEHELQVYDDEDENELEMRQILEEHNRNLKLQASQADSHLNQNQNQRKPLKQNQIANLQESDILSSQKSQAQSMKSQQSMLQSAGIVKNKSKDKFKSNTQRAPSPKQIAPKERLGSALPKEKSAGDVLKQNLQSSKPQFSKTQQSARPLTSKQRTIDSSQRKSFGTIDKSEAGTIRTVATRAGSNKKSSRSRKVTSSFGADLSKVYNFDAPEKTEGLGGGKLAERFSGMASLSVTKQRKLVKDYMENKMKELKETYRSNAELAARLQELSKIVKMSESSLNIDSLTATKVDAKVAGIIFAEVHIVEKIEILADKTEPDGIEKLYNLLQRTAARKGGKQDEGQVTKKVSQNTVETYNVINGICKNLQAPQGSMLQYLHVINISMSVHAWKSIQKGLTHTQSLKTLKLNLLVMGREALLQISEGMKFNTTVTHLDLGFNNLKDSDGDILARIVAYQTQRRDQSKWKTGLRPKGQSSGSSGLSELCLQYNKLGAFFLKSILEALKYDDYLRTLDLRKNKFTTAILNDTQDIDFIKSFQRNESLTNIDFRQNEGFNKQMKFKLSLIMIRNIDSLRSKGVFVQGSHLNKDVLMLDETINSTINSRALSPASDGVNDNKSDATDDSIFNIELSNIASAMGKEKAFAKTVMTGSTKAQQKTKVVPRGQSQRKANGIARAKSAKKKVAEPCEWHESSGVVAAKKMKASKSIAGQPSGYHVTNDSRYPDKQGISTQKPPIQGIIKKTVNQDISDSKKLDSSDQDIQPPYTSDAKKGRFEFEDDEGQKYLNYKSISGMDLVPRIREPTPQKLKAKKAGDHLDQERDDCDKCSLYKQKYEEMLQENQMLKEELEKVQTNFENLRVQQKITNLTKASKKGMIQSVDYSKNFSVRDLQR